MNKVLLLIFLTILLGCKDKKPADYDKFYNEAMEHVEYVTEHIDSINFFKDREIFEPTLKDSVLTLNMLNVREGINLDGQCKETYDIAVKCNIPIKACIMIDNKGNIIGKYINDGKDL